MCQAKYAWILLALTIITVRAQDGISEQTGSPGADKKDMYCTGTEVTAPRLHRRVYVPYPENVPAREVQGIAVLAMVIDASGIPAHI